MTEMIHVGQSPAGVLWNVYRKDGETREQMQERAAQQRVTLMRHWTRAAEKGSPAARLRVGLTANQVYVLEEVMESLGKDADRITCGKTYAIVPVDLVCDVIRLLQEHAEDMENWWEPESFDCSEAQHEFGLRQAQRTPLSTAHKLRKAAKARGIPV